MFGVGARSDNFAAEGSKLLSFCNHFSFFVVCPVDKLADRLISRAFSVVKRYVPSLWRCFACAGKYYSILGLHYVTQHVYRVRRARPCPHVVLLKRCSRD